MIELIVPDANALADLIPRVRAVAMEAHRLAPSDGDIPASPFGTYSDLNRALSRRVTPWHSAPKRSPWHAASAIVRVHATAR